VPDVVSGGLVVSPLTVPSVIAVMHASLLWHVAGEPVSPGASGGALSIGTGTGAPASGVTPPDTVQAPATHC
jgi:uncharacterized membrane protein YdfJ with MMPL/SSD domain